MLHLRRERERVEARGRPFRRGRERLDDRRRPRRGPPLGGEDVVGVAEPACPATGARRAPRARGPGRAR